MKTALYILGAFSVMIWMMSEPFFEFFFTRLPAKQRNQHFQDNIDSELTELIDAINSKKEGRVIEAFKGYNAYNISELSIRYGLKWQDGWFRGLPYFIRTNTSPVLKEVFEYGIYWNDEFIKSIYG